MSDVTRKISMKPGMKVLEDVVRVDVLKPHIERFSTVDEGLAQSRAYQEEIMKVGKITGKAGFSPGRDFFRMARIPSSVWSAVMEVFGNEWNAADPMEKKKIFTALLAGPLQDYDMRRKPTLT